MVHYITHYIVNKIWQATNSQDHFRMLFFALSIDLAGYSGAILLENGFTASTVYMIIHFQAVRHFSGYLSTLS